MLFLGLFYARADVLPLERPSHRSGTMSCNIEGRALSFGQFTGQTRPLIFLRLIPISNLIRRMTLAPAAPIIRRPRPIHVGQIPPPGADKMTVGRCLHRPVTVGSRNAAGVMIAGLHRHLPLAFCGIIYKGS